MRKAARSTRWRGRSRRKRTGGNVDPALGRVRVAGRAGRVAAGQVGEKERLAHRLVVLGLVADDQLEKRPVAGAPGGQHVQRARADGGEVVEDVLPAQERDVAAYRARRLEGVVEVGEVAAQQLAAAVAMDEPEVLVSGDVAQVP